MVTLKEDLKGLKEHLTVLECKIQSDIEPFVNLSTDYYVHLNVSFTQLIGMISITIKYLEDQS